MALVLDSNPLREGLTGQIAAEPCAMVLFGASGDLVYRKIMPSIFSLSCRGLLPRGLSVIGVAQTPYTDDQFRYRMREAVELAGELRPGTCLWEDFADGLSYLSADYNDLANYHKLADMLRSSDDTRGTAGNRIFHLAVPPSGFNVIARNLRESGLAEGNGWKRIIVEKPFGWDMESAKILDEELLSAFDESQIFRIDHYLGKETVRNILVLRFANSIFEPLWNHKYIDHIQITIAESLGVEKRGAFYERVGALRDVIQNHALQLVALTAMEPPASLDADDIRDEKQKVLKNIRRMDQNEVHRFVLRGQYNSGFQLGERVPAYREESKVDPASNTETFVALELHIDNWRWSGVPFYIRTGKRLARMSTEIAVQFKDVPDVLFRENLLGEVEPNLLIIRIQPDEGVSIKMESKAPGLDFRLRPVQMDFRYGSSFGAPMPEAYERLLLDVVLGDSSLFARRDSVEECWDIMTPILRAWEQNPPHDFPNYLPGTWGPQSSFKLIERNSRRWRRF